MDITCEIKCILNISISMNKKLISFIKLIDSILTRFSPRFSQEENSLLIFVFHGLFCNEKEKTLNLVDPRLFITIENFRIVLEYCLDDNYIFISPNDILKGLNNDKNYILITFDDGYFNNQHALPTLREYEIPAVFSISTNNVKYNKCFWWDVLYREGIRHNKSINEITSVNKQLKQKTTEEREKYLMDLYGNEAFKPISDIDRPFTPSELKDFSKDKYVFLGNHTDNHNILTNYSPKDIKSHIFCAQNDIYNFTGLIPIVIAYPDGSYSDEIIGISKEIGLKLGFIGEFKKNYLSTDCQGDGCLRLGRFNLYGCDNSKECIDHCDVFMSDIILCNWIIRNLSINLYKK